MPLSQHHTRYFTIEQRETLQRLLEEALARVHEPDFGVCADCSAEITFARLLANPSATRCRACQAVAEKT